MKSLARQLTPDHNRSLRSRTAGCNSRFSGEPLARPLTGRRQPRWAVLNLTESLLRSRFVYEPFGPNGGWSWGNHGTANSAINQHLRVFDLDYRPTAISSDPDGYNRDIKWDQANRITGITVPGTSGGAPTITIPGIGNALSVNQTYQYDALDRLTSMIPGNPTGTNAATGLAFLPKEQFSYDAIGNRMSRVTTPPGSTTASTATYAYPNTSATPLASRNHTLTGLTGSTTWAYQYDATGNTTKEGSNPANAATTAFTNTFDAKNRLNKVQIGSTTANTVTYKINALGQRIQKTGAGTYAYSTSTTISGTTGLSPQATTLQYNARYVYDEQGRLLGEYSPEGKLISETIWFDDLPVATIRPKGSSTQLPLGIAGTGAATANNTGANTAANPANVDTFYLHPDHLGTSRAVTRSVAVAGATTGPNAVNKAVWRWESDPFGTSGATGAGGSAASAPNENPQVVTGTQTQIQAASFKLNNRFPGQLFDAESGKSYNYFRSYDSAVDRYTTSDPIGLTAGMNTFAYVGANPISFVDADGLVKCTFSIGGGTLICAPERTPGPPQTFSGLAGAGSCQNKVDCECMTDLGPLPRGGYGMGLPNSGTMKGGAIPLNPLQPLCSRRNSFYIHGTARPTTGCIQLQLTGDLKWLIDNTRRDGGGRLDVID